MGAGLPIGKGTFTRRSVDRYLVDQMIHASDNCQTYLAGTLFFAGGFVGVAVALAGGAEHPGVLYAMAGIFGVVTLLGLLVTKHEFKGARTVRDGLDAATSDLSIPVLFTPAFSATPSASSSGFLPATGEEE